MGEDHGSSTEGSSRRPPTRSTGPRGQWVIENAQLAEGKGRLPSSARLRRSQDFTRLFALRNSASGDWLVVYGQRNQLERSRLGISIGRGFGSAVQRNRWKRLVREAFRLTSEAQPTGWDWIALPRRRGPMDAAFPTLALMANDLVRTMRRVANRESRRS